MKPYLWLFLGINIGMYMNSATGASHGMAAGKWCREKLIKYDMLPAAWKTTPPQNPDEE